MNNNNIIQYHLQKFVEFNPKLILLTFVPQAHNVLHYEAGQYIEIEYPDGSFQPFSIANAPQPDHQIELHIRLRPDDLPLVKLLEKIQQDKTIALRGPYGTAFYRRNDASSVILLAGGTGFAYVKAIMEAAIAAKDPRFFYLYWGVKETHDFYLLALLDQWTTQLKNFRYTLTISQPKQTEQNKTGYVQQAVIADHPDLADFEVYGSGPYALIQSALTLFQAHALKKAHFYSDMLS